MFFFVAIEQTLATRFPLKLEGVHASMWKQLYKLHACLVSKHGVHLMEKGTHGTSLSGEGGGKNDRTREDQVVASQTQRG